jgi:nitrite reductase/ring-hydroxylating ferredoxin subunit
MCAEVRTRSPDEAAASATPVSSEHRPMARDLYADEYPASWYCVSPSASLKNGGIKPFEALGRKLVMYRTESGAVRIVDRFCPHMGASLHTGTVKGERIQCPFHHWEYGADGKCEHIPYQEKIPQRACLDTFPVVEHLGWIWMWNGAEPSYTLPDLPEAHDGKHGYRAKTQFFDAHPLLMLENGCDAQHFKYVHKVNFARYDVTITQQEEHAFGFDVDQEMAAPFGKRFVIQTQIHYVGASAIFGALSFNGVQRARFVAAPLPIGGKRTLFHLMVFPKKLPLPLFFVNPLYEWFFARQLFIGSTDDYLPIWRHMDTSRRGVLVEEDRLQQKFRRYYEDHFPAPPTSPNVLPILQSA